MTHATRFVAVAVLVALAIGAPVQAQTPEIDALRALAEAGDAEAQFNLGAMYDIGQGVPQDDAEAVRLYRLAAGQGFASVQNRDHAARLLTAEQLAEAQRRAREWTPTPER